MARIVKLLNSYEIMAVYQLEESLKERTIMRTVAMTKIQIIIQKRLYKMNIERKA